MPRLTEFRYLGKERTTHPINQTSVTEYLLIPCAEVWSRSASSESFVWTRGHMAAVGRQLGAAVLKGHDTLVRLFSE